QALAPSPTRLSADRVTAGFARLHWSAPANSPAPDSYEIRRDDVVVNTIAGTATSYLDTGLSPATKYYYQIAALWDMNESGPTSPLTIKTATPPLSAARLEGSSVPVKLTIVANDTVVNMHTGQHWTDTWDITPKCAAGPCAVEVSGNFAPP